MAIGSDVFLLIAVLENPLKPFAKQNVAVIKNPGQPQDEDATPLSFNTKEIEMKKTALLLTALLAVGAQAQTSVGEAWIRGTVPQQKATGMFANITSARGGKLVSASTPVAGVVEIHEMSMEGSTMKMRALTNGLDLPAGKAVALKPGGYHVMLMDLKQQLKEGDTVAVTLVVEGADKQRETIVVKAPVKALNTPAAAEHKH